MCDVIDDFTDDDTFYLYKKPRCNCTKNILSFGSFRKLVDFL